LCGRLAERNSQGREKLASFVIRVCCSYNGKIEANRTTDLVNFDLGENGVIGNSDGVISTSIERLRRKTAKVANRWRSHIDETVKKLPHLSTAQGNASADGVTNTKLEVRDRDLGTGRDSKLTCNLSEILNHCLSGSLAIIFASETAVDDNLLDGRDLMDVLVSELLLKCGDDLFLVNGFQC